MFGTFAFERWYVSPDRLSIKSTVQRALIAAKEPFSVGASTSSMRATNERALRDDWTTFAHDDLRSGYERRATGITRDTASLLRRRWLRALNEPVRASPLAVGGALYVATDQGNVYALDAATGDLRWKQRVGSSVRMTPALVHGTLFVGTYGALGPPGAVPHGATFQALDAQTGAVRWRRSLPGLVRSEPVIIDGVVYEGLAGGDPFSGCFDGRVIALDEKTGALLPMQWMTSPKHRNGGGIWGPLSTDGSTIYVGTGNTCDAQGIAGHGDSVVAMTRSLQTVWRASTKVSAGDDSDVGGGVALVGPYAYVAGKNGYFYQLDRATGRILRRTDLAPFKRDAGSIATPTGDGSVLVISGGVHSNPTAPSAPSCIISAFAPDGSERYRFTSEYPVTGYAAFVAGVGFIALDRSLVAFDSGTGERLWSADLGDFSYASPIVVPSGVYAVTNAGDVHAFGPPEESLANAKPHG